MKHKTPAIAEEIRTNKVNIYLIKRNYTDFDQIVKLQPGIAETELPTGRLYTASSEVETPSWIDDFFLKDPRINLEHIYVAAASGVFVCKVKITRGYRFFAIPFGVSGRFLLKDHVTEDRFGLITAVNLAAEDKIRSMDKWTLSSNTKLSREQLSKVGTTTDFGVDIERDLLHGITAQTDEPGFGKTITGKDGLLVSTKVNFANIHELLKRAYHFYNLKVYKDKFPWIDFLKDVKEPATLEELNENLAELILDRSENVWLAVPDLLEWTEIGGFTYSQRKRDDWYEDLSIADFLSEIEKLEALAIADLENTVVSAWDKEGSQIKRRWSVFQCLNAELAMKGRLYILSNGKWYDVAPTFVAEVEKSVKHISSSPIDFPIYEHENENDYNNDLADELGGYCLDAQNIIFGGGRSRIEFCDVLAPGKNMIHAKKYGGSSVLSHLFNQGMVSAELLTGSEEFRKLVRAKLPVGPFRNMIPESRPNARQYKVIFAIIGNLKGDGKINIPFFSKVALRRCYQLLTGFNYGVHVNFIPMADCTTEDLEEAD